MSTANFLNILFLKRRNFVRTLKKIEQSFFKFTLCLVPTTTTTILLVGDSNNDDIQNLKYQL
jgi:hypothetical protein